jgi:hypothetical protein
MLHMINFKHHCLLILEVHSKQSRAKVSNTDDFFDLETLFKLATSQLFSDFLNVVRSAQPQIVKICQFLNYVSKLDSWFFHDRSLLTLVFAISVAIGFNSILIENHMHPSLPFLIHFHNLSGNLLINLNFINLRPLNLFLLANLLN